MGSVRTWNEAWSGKVWIEIRRRFRKKKLKMGVELGYNVCE